MTMFGFFSTKKRRAVTITAITADGKQKLNGTFDVAFSDSMEHFEIKKQLAEKLHEQGCPKLDVSSIEIKNIRLI